MGQHVVPYPVPGGVTVIAMFMTVLFVYVNVGTYCNTNCITIKSAVSVAHSVCMINAVSA